ncbi:MAG: N-acetylmuramoyl-L-alanine amidase [Bacteroidia bacterium]
MHHNISGSRLPLDWKPSWSRTPNKPYETARTGGITSVTGIIVHHTAGRVIGTAYNTFMNPGTPVTAHYLIDLNGHVIKLKQDKHLSNHAGCSKWRGSMGMNASTIGIEIVNSSGPYPQGQMDGLLSLLQALTSAYASHLPATNIFGHSDIAILRARQPMSARLARPQRRAIRGSSLIGAKSRHCNWAWFPALWQHSEQPMGTFSPALGWNCGLETGTRGTDMAAILAVGQRNP